MELVTDRATDQAHMRSIGLTLNQVDILRGLASGYSAVEIAKISNRSVATIRKTLALIKRSLDAQSNIQAVYLATKIGLI